MPTEPQVISEEQIAQHVAEMQTQLDACAQKGHAYRMRWRDVKAIIKIITTLQERLAQANNFNNDIVEREAAVCPEDVGFDEFIRSLQSRLSEVEKERDTLLDKLAAEVAERVNKNVARMEDRRLTDAQRGSYE